MNEELKQLKQTIADGYLTQGRSTMAENQQSEAYELRNKISSLKSKLEDLKKIITNSLIGIDWTLKLGMAVALWFFPIPQDRLIQSIGVLCYVCLLTLVSKTIVKLKSYQIDGD